LLFPKTKRFTLGQKIDEVTLATIEYVIFAGYATKERKLPILEKAIVNVNLLKILLRLAKDTNALDNRKYIALEQSILEIGRMLGGWKRSL